MAVGPVSDSGAIDVTLPFVTGWVTVVLLLLVTPVITLQLQNTDEPGGRR